MRNALHTAAAQCLVFNSPIASHGNGAIVCIPRHLPRNNDTAICIDRMEAYDAMSYPDDMQSS
jgi:hypothetical protein